MSYRIAGIDVHKRMLAVVIAEVGAEEPSVVQRKRVGSSPQQLREMAAWFVQEQVQRVVMESTAQYWKPVWDTLERFWRSAVQAQIEAISFSGKLYLAQAKSNRGARGRKNDFADAERLLRRLLAGELILSFVPEPEQRLWRTVTRRREQMTGARVRLQNQLECLLEEAHIKLSSMVSDLLGVSGRRILRAIAENQTNPEQIAALADRNLRASQESLRDALDAVRAMQPVYRRLLRMMLEELDLLEEHMVQLEQQAAELMAAHSDAIRRLAEIPGVRVRSAQQIVAELGPQATAFSSAKAQSSWVGVCPGQEESAGVSASHRSPRGNCHMKRILNQAAHAAVKVKGSIFELKFNRLKARLGYRQAICAIAHQLCRVIWKILHDGVSYEERGPAINAQRLRVRTNRMIRDLKHLGFHVEGPIPPQTTSA